MKVLVVGAGALGGYYGARLLQNNRDVTFLLRDKRMKQLQATDGLHIKSSHGDAHIAFADLKCVTKDEISQPFDLIILSCKAYSFESCMNDFAPAVGENTMILPLLNGIEHMDILAERFGQGRILGGFAVISATLDADGRVLHLNQIHDLVFGEVSGENTARVQAVTQTLEHCGFDAKYSANIMQAMWNKWIMIATAAGATSMFRAAICDIVKAGGANYISELLDECLSIAKHCGYEPDEQTSLTLCTNLTSENNPLMASMLKDIEKGNPIESDALIEDFMRRASPELYLSLRMLPLVRTHLNAYTVRQKLDH